MMTEGQIKNLFEEYNVPLVVDNKKVLTLKNVAYLLDLDKDTLLNTICRLRKKEEKGEYLPLRMRGLAETYDKSSVKNLEFEKNIIYATFPKNYFNSVKKFILIDLESFKKIATYFKKDSMIEPILKYYYQVKLQTSIKEKAKVNYQTFDYNNQDFRILNTKSDKKYSLKDVCDILNMNMKEVLSELTENSFQVIEFCSENIKETSVIIGEDGMFEVFKMKFDSIIESNTSDLTKLHDFRSWFIFQILIKK